MPPEVWAESAFDEFRRTCTLDSVVGVLMAPKEALGVNWVEFITVA